MGVQVLRVGPGYSNGCDASNASHEVGHEASDEERAVPVVRGHHQVEEDGRERSAATMM